MRLSERMHMVADMVSKGEVLADIGCDHGYVAMWLAKEKKCPILSYPGAEDYVKAYQDFFEKITDQ